MIRRRIKTAISRINLFGLATASSLAFLLFLFPLNVALGDLIPERVIGIEGSFLAGLFLLPGIIGLLLFWICKKADDLERHMRKFENE